jgi:phenylpropionate dioxygenase-like ring-hydroxylating dioxygenase large terminal subunit
MATDVTDLRWASKYPELGSDPLPTEPYISEEYFQLELERIYRKVWLYIGSLDDCPNPGDFFVREIEALGVSLLVMHGKDGEIRAFHNVCSHRGNKLVWTPYGCTKGYLGCGFHGWTYDLKGCLRGVMDEGNFAPLPKEQLGLTPVRTAIWKRFVFINLDDEGTETLEEYLGPVAEALDPLPFEDIPLRWRYDVPEQANWKIALDAQDEIYHLPVLGPVHESTAQFYTLTEEGYTRLTAFERLGRHTVWSTDKNPEYEPIGVEKLVLGKGSRPEVDLPTRGGGIFDFYLIFPNMVLSILSGGLFTYMFWPLAVDRSVWEIRIHGPQPKNAGDLLFQHWTKGKFRDTLAEDIAGHEQTHAGLASRAKSRFYLQDDEIQIRAFHKTLHEYVDPGEVM